MSKTTHEALAPAPYSEDRHHGIARKLTEPGRQGRDDSIPTTADSRPTGTEVGAAGLSTGGLFDRLPDGGDPVLAGTDLVGDTVLFPVAD